MDHRKKRQASKRTAMPKNENVWRRNIRIRSGILEEACYPAGFVCKDLGWELQILFITQRADHTVFIKHIWSSYSQQ